MDGVASVDPLHSVQWFLKRQSRDGLGLGLSRLFRPALSERS